MNDALANGGNVTFYVDMSIGGTANRVVKGDMTVNMYENTKLTLGSSSYGVTVDDGAKLTINGKNVEVDKAVVVAKGGELVINAAKVNAKNSLVAQVVGTLTIGANAEITATGHAVANVQPGSKVTLNGTVNAKNLVTVAAAPAYGETAAEVVVEGGTFTTTGDAFNVINGMVLTINGGTLKANAGLTTLSHVISLTDGKVTINGGTLTSSAAAVQTEGTADTASLTINGGTLVATYTDRYALLFRNAKATYVLAGGTYESKGSKDTAAISLDTAFFDAKTGELIADQKGIITGGKYLNNVVAVIKNTKTGANYDATNDLVAEGYTVKEEGNYKVVVSTKAENDKKPAAKPEEQAPNTYDAGLVYMGLALSAIGASVVSVRKLRNN